VRVQLRQGRADLDKPFFTGFARRLKDHAIMIRPAAAAAAVTASPSPAIESI
jgi:hypothetical protein